MYDLLQYLVPLVSKFPKSQRYLLGERLEQTCCDVLELLIAAAYARDKRTLLPQANVKLEQARYYVRLRKDTKHLSLHHYEVLSKKMNEVGVQLGGWMKHVRKRP